MPGHAHASPKWTLNRRGLLVGTAGVVASTGLAQVLGWSERAEAAEAHDWDDSNPSLRGVMPPPEPIPGGTEIPGGLLHGFAPGPKGRKFPYSGFELQGENVEPSTITDFKGFTALAMLVGEKAARGSDGKTYHLESDIRAFDGTYLAADGSRHRGRFAFI